MQYAWILISLLPGPGAGEVFAAEAPPILVPELLRQARAADEAADRAFLALTDEGARAVPGLRKVLAEGPSELRPIAAQALAAIGSPSAAAVGELLIAAKDPDVAMRAEALRALAELPASDDGRPAITFAISLTDANDNIRRLAIEGLARLGPAAAEATPALAFIVAREAPANLKARAALALGRIGPAAIPVSFSLVEGLRSPDPAVAARCGEALVRLGPDVAGMVLDAAQTERDLAALMKLIDVLGDLGPGGKVASDWLHEQLEHPEASIRRTAGAALERIESP
jgi:HEAT repeat protein